MSATRCLAVDDHEAVRTGMALLLGPESDLELVGVADCGERAVEMVSELDPDVVVVDMRMPGMDGISTVRQLTTLAPAVHEVIYSGYSDKRLIGDALSAGANGFVAKRSPSGDLVRAIRTVATGQPFVDPSLSATLLMPDRGERPSEREREVLQQYADGLHTEGVARMLGLGVEAVKADCRRAMARLGASTRTQAVAVALRDGFIE